MVGASAHAVSDLHPESVAEERGKRGRERTSYLSHGSPGVLTLTSGPRHLRNTFLLLSVLSVQLPEEQAATFV